MLEYEEVTTARRGGSMSGFPSAAGGHGARQHLSLPDVVSEFLAPAAATTGTNNKRKRRPAGTPDPGAEVVALSPKTLMESDRYVCEICNQGFQRDQNLQMHRRRHKVPWKLLKRPSLGNHKRVYVCPERSCLHHNPAHALGDLVGIKKHYRRKHCTEKQWKCDKCFKRYAVQSDFKAHLKTCGTRGHCCDCGRVFSRVESFIEHQDTCTGEKQTSMQLSGEAPGDRKLLVHQDVTDRNSHDSQTSDTTQTVSFAQSGVSERSGDSIKAPTADGVDHSRRIVANQQALTTSAYNAVALPAWLMDRRGNELELLQPPAHSAFPRIPRAVVDHGSGSTRSQISSMNSVGLPEDANTPSLKLSIGPYEGDSFVDTKPSLRSVEKEALTLACQQGCSSGNNSRPSSDEAVPLGIARTDVTSSRAQLGNDLVLSIRNQETDGPGTDPASSLTDFLVQAAGRRRGPASSKAVEFHRSQKQTLSRNSEMVVHYNPRPAGTPGSNSLFHENRAGKIHDSEPSGIGVVRRGSNSHHSRLESTTSTVSSRQVLDLMDVAETDHAFAALQSRGHETIISQKQFAAGRVEANEGCEQAPTEIHTAWSVVLAAAGRSRGQARQESDDAQRELVRADRLGREAHEQLQLASAERAYAESELAKAHLLREHAQAELETAHFLLLRDRSAGTSASSQDQGFKLCHSCKSAIETRPQGMDVDHRSDWH